MAVTLQLLNEVTVTTAGTAVPLSSTSLMVYSVSVQSLSTNSGTQYIGDNTVSSTKGQSFGPGDIAEVDGPPSAKGQEQFDVSKIYVDSSSNGAKFRVSVWTR